MNTNQICTVNGCESYFIKIYCYFLFNIVFNNLVLDNLLCISCQIYLYFRIKTKLGLNGGQYTGQ